MKTTLLTLAVVLCAFASFATKGSLSPGRIVSEKSVECGTKNAGKKSSTAVLCQQYTVNAGTTEYQIRQLKPSAEAIIPANTAIQFVTEKDRMKFKWNGKNYEFVIVGTSALAAPDSGPR